MAAMKKVGLAVAAALLLVTAVAGPAEATGVIQTGVIVTGPRR